jgi:hypothetical protein
VLATLALPLLATRRVAMDPLSALRADDVARRRAAPTFSPSALVGTRAGHDAHEVAVSREDIAIGEQQQGLRHALRDQHAIERVAVNRRQRADLRRVRAGNRQFDESHLHESGSELARVDVEVRTLERGLDGDLPQARGAVVDLVLGASMSSRTGLARRSLLAAAHSSRWVSTRSRINLPRMRAARPRARGD